MPTDPAGDATTAWVGEDLLPIGEHYLQKLQAGIPTLQSFIPASESDHIQATGLNPS